MTFVQNVQETIDRTGSMVCVGLDSDIARLPPSVTGQSHPQFVFNRAIIDATRDLVAAYKPNTAFYEARGAAGIEDLKLTCDYIRRTCPGVILILDAKRGDIGSTNDAYAAYAFDYLGADAVTLHPYLGREALAPFLSRPEKGCIVLCRTSNPGAGELQDLQVAGEPLYLTVARRVATSWNTGCNCMLVVGATYPEELTRVRDMVGDMPILVPGIGAQGGDIGRTLSAGADSRGGGLLLTSSRAIIFADPAGNDYAAAARAAAERLRTDIQTYRNAAARQ